MKALSLRRPWPTLILAGGKTIENRTWSTSYRGPVIIYASKTWDGHGAADLAEHVYGDLGCPVPIGTLRNSPELFPVGYIGVVDLVDVCPGGCKTCGLWAMRECCHWKLRNPRLFPEPVPGLGRLSLFDPPPEAIEAVARLEAVAT